MPETTSLTALAERLELWPIDKLRPYERNPRTHSADQVAQLAASMVEFGFTNAILVDESGGMSVRQWAKRRHRGERPGDARRRGAGPARGGALRVDGFPVQRRDDGWLPCSEVGRETKEATGEGFGHAISI
jgi:hypothetical protein